MRLGNKATAEKHMFPFIMIRLAIVGEVERRDDVEMPESGDAVETDESDDETPTPAADEDTRFWRYSWPTPLPEQKPGRHAVRFDEIVINGRTNDAKAALAAVKVDGTAEAAAAHRFNTTAKIIKRPILRRVLGNDWDLGKTLTSDGVYCYILVVPKGTLLAANRYSAKAQAARKVTQTAAALTKTVAKAKAKLGTLMARARKERAKLAPASADGERAIARPRTLARTATPRTRLARTATPRAQALTLS